MGTWIQRAPMPTPRHDLQTIAVDGSIYAISGAGDLTVDAVEIYDVVTDTWSLGPPIPTKRGWLGAGLLDGKIYAAGGKKLRTPEEKAESGNDATFEVRDAFEVLDLETQTWSALEPLPEPRAGVDLAVCGGQIYTVGGNNINGRGQMNDVQVYDPDTGNWSPGPAYPFRVQMPGVIAVEGRIYAMGGHSMELDGGTFRAEMFVLDPDVGRWEPLAPMPTARESLGLVELDGKIYAFAGKGFDYSDNTEIYDLASDTWSADAPLPEPRGWVDAARVGRRMFVMGGALAWPDQPGHKWFDETVEFVL